MRILLFITGVALVYLGFSFCHWTFNPELWEYTDYRQVAQSDRGYFCVIAFIVGLVFTLLPDLYKSINKNL